MWVKSKGEFLHCAISQSASHFTLTSLIDLFNQTSYQLLWEVSSHAAINARRLLVYTYQPLSTARYSFIHLCKLEQCRANNLPKVLTPQHRFQTRVLLVESPKLYPWATALFKLIYGWKGGGEDDRQCEERTGLREIRKGRRRIENNSNR